MPTPDSDTQGVGAYFEYHSPANTTLITFQLVILPEGYTPTLQRVSPMAYYRHLNHYATRKSWIPSLFNMSQLNLDNPESIAEAFKSFLNRIVVGEYTQVSKPFTFEVSNKDLQQSATGKLPTRINSKIKSMRLAHGYPENLVRTKEVVEDAH